MSTFLLIIEEHLRMAVSRRISYISLLTFLLFSTIFFTSCSYFYVVKKYPDKQPFIYKTNVHVEGNYSPDEKKELEFQLSQQLHDSVKARTVAKAIGWLRGPRLFYEVLERPTLFDSLHADKSVEFMRSYLNSLGYFRDSTYYTVKIDSSKDGHQLRTHLDFYVQPRTVTKLDSIAYALNADTRPVSLNQRQSLDTIQRITLNSLLNTFIKKGDPFSKYQLSLERDRLANLYRDNGYLKFSEEEMLVLWDTVGIDLLRPTIDPIEQANLLQRLAERRANPVADVEFRLRENPDTTRITRYYVGKVTVYPEFTNDTTKNYRFIDTMGRYVIKHNEGMFKKRIFPYYILLRPGDLYRQSNYLKTQNKFNALSAWRLVSIAQTPRPGQDTADIAIRLTPATKYSFNTNFGVSLNQGGLILAQGNLVGFAFNAALQNRNFSKGANLAITNVRFGIELNSTVGRFIQTKQISAGHTIQIPRIWPKLFRFLSKNKENINTTNLSLNGGITQRRDYFTLTSASTSFGNTFSWVNKKNRSKSLTYRLPNIEYNYLLRKDSLEALIAKNASYKYIFNTGMIISGLINYNRVGGHGDISNLFSVSGELAFPLGFARSRTLSTNLYQFIKADVEYRWTKKYFRDALATRVFGGIGVGLQNRKDRIDKDSTNRYLPFFREYYAGGPNSMRAWSVRKLGPGSALRSFDRIDAPDRFGDVRIEANIEYRKYLLTYKGITLNTALYTDIGNVWSLRRNPDFVNGEFPTTLAKLWEDLGVGVGTGLRVDFGFLKVRLDYAYKAKDPTPSDPAAQNVWFYKWKPLEGQLQLGIDYPF